jgi:organic hydroperoxide reductase OsmC/OhrA
MVPGFRGKCAWHRRCNDQVASHRLEDPMRSVYNAAPIPHDESATNPNQLFAAAVASCFESALRLAARLQKKPLCRMRSRLRQ